MIDDTKSERPYIHTLAKYYLPCEANCPACAYEAGRKAERERCARIAENEAGEIPECMTGRIIAEKIRGGKDGE